MNMLVRYPDAKGLTLCDQLVTPTMQDIKRMTRRVLEPQPPAWANDPQPVVGPWCHFHGTHPLGSCGHPRCACSAGRRGENAMFTVKGHYKRGEILYVRESHYCFGNWFYGPKNDGMGWTFYPVARGTDEPHTFEQPEKFHISRDKKNPQHPQWYKRLARFMPKAYARTFLEVVSVRVERLQNISEVDAFAEGVIFVISMEDEPAEAGGKPFLPGRAAFRKLWEEINGTGSWNANPWVWVIEFKRISP